MKTDLLGQIAKLGVEWTGTTRQNRIFFPHFNFKTASLRTFFPKSDFSKSRLNGTMYK